MPPFSSIINRFANSFQYLILYDIKKVSIYQLIFLPLCFNLHEKSKHRRNYLKYSKQKNPPDIKYPRDPSNNQLIKIIYSLRFYQSLVLMMLHQLIHRRYLAVQIILVRWLQIQIHHTGYGLLLL